LKILDGGTVHVNELETAIGQAMEKANVAGLSVAILNDDQIAYTHAFDFRDKAAGIPFDEETVTGAASLSKTVFAYLVMLLAEEGVINLDKSLQAYLAKPLPDYPAYADLAGDDRYKQITARMVLSHSTGFPNWRWLEPDKLLSFLFAPGTRHSYSGEGIALLQMVVEEITGRDLETLAREKVFEPLGMTRTSYAWREAFEANAARPHDEFSRPKRLPRRTKPDAAGSMVTTAEDYARLLVAILNATGQRKATVVEILRSQIAISYEQMFGPGAWRDTNKYQDIHLAWGLGWGRFDTEQGRAFFHTGHDLGYQNYTVTFADQGIGIVLLSNSDNFESVAREIAQATIGDHHSPFDWLGYVPFDPSKVKTPPPEPVVIEVDPAILRAYVGAYELSADKVMQVKVEDWKLYISVDGQQWDQAYAESETRFFAQGDDTRVVFVKDDAGQVTGLNLEMQGLVLPTKKVR
jgi:CubicO group peptidase (beta-lactamase class C family)